MSNSAPDIRAVRGSKRWYVTYKDAYGNRIREYGGINRIKNKSEKEKALQQLLLEIKEKHKIESSLSIKELLYVRHVFYKTTFDQVHTVLQGALYFVGPLMDEYILKDNLNG